MKNKIYIFLIFLHSFFSIQNVSSNEIFINASSVEVDKESKMAYDVIQSKNYPVKIQKASNIINDIKTINPDIIINDILDTKLDYIKSLKENNYKIINFLNKIYNYNFNIIFFKTFSY